MVVMRPWVNEVLRLPISRQTLRWIERVRTEAARARDWFRTSVSDRLPEPSERTLRRVEMALFVSCRVTLVYAAYALWTTEARTVPIHLDGMFSGHSQTDSRTALFLILVGSFGTLVFVGCVAYVMKLVTNLFIAFLEAAVPATLHSVATSLTILAMALCFLPAAPTVKGAGLGAYRHVRETLQHAKLFDPTAAVKRIGIREGRYEIID